MSLEYIKTLEVVEGDIFLPYRDNPKVKKVGSHTIITPERAAEYLKCMEDPLYFCRNYLKIITLDHGIQPFNPRPYQEKTINTILDNRFVVCKWGRQPLCLDTLVKIPNGYKKLKDIKRNETVIGLEGKPTKVLSVSEIYHENIEVYEISFKTKKVKADTDHIWNVEINGISEELSTKMLLKAIQENQVYVQTLTGKQLVQSVKKVKPVPVKCIEVDAPDGLYCITEDDILTHNSGKTTTVAAVVVWLLMFNEEGAYEAGILAHKQDQAIEIMERIKTYYENLPLWFQKNVKTWNKKTVELEGKSKAFAAATGSGAVRGRSLNFCFSDEFALVEQAQEFFTGTFPTISSGTNSKFVIASTPKGLANYFYKIWKEAEDGKSGFIPLAIEWWEVPGRDAEWKRKEIARTSEAIFSQEYEAEFLGSSNTLITGKKLGEIVFNDPISMDETKEHLFIFKHPEPQKKYLICADVSEGVGGDSSSFVVFDVSQMPYEIVATYDNNFLDPLLYPNVLFDIGTFYNNAFVAIESNTIGHGVVNTLYLDLEYENIISTDTKKKTQDDIMEGGRQKLGIRQTKATRHKGNSLLKTLVENDQLMINDFRIFYQLSRYIRKNGKFQAENNEHDDLVMCLVIFAYLTSLPTFKDITGTDISLALNQQKIHDIHMPLGIIITSGLDDSLLTSFENISEFDQWLIN